MTTYYAHLMPRGPDKEPVFQNFFPAKWLVEECGDAPAVEVTLTEVEEGETHWGWRDTGKEEIGMIYPAKFMLEMCMPYGMQAEIDAGNGQPVKLIVTEVPTDD